MRTPNPPRFRAVLLVPVAVMWAACDSARPTAAEIELSDYVATLVVGESRAITATCYDAAGSPIPGHPVQWLADSPQLATLRTSGNTAIVYAMHPGTWIWIRAACQRDPLVRTFNDAATILPPTHTAAAFTVIAPPIGSWAVEDVTDTIVLRQATPDDSTRGVSHQVIARGLTTNGQLVPPSAFTYAIFDTLVARVSTTGRVTARYVGETQLHVSLGGETRVLPVSVRNLPPAAAPWDAALIDAHWTQGPQDHAQSVPMLRGGRAAVVNVVAAIDVDSVPVQVELEVFDATAAVVFTDTALLRLSADSAPSFASPNAQFLIPRPIVSEASSWRLRLLGDGVDADAAPSNNRLPRTGLAALRVHTPPVLKLHLVPIVLSAHGNAMTTVLPENAVQYDSIVRLRLPVGEVQVTIGAPVVSAADFFAENEDSTQGNGWFFYRVLGDVDAARVKASSLSDRYWIGVIPKPAGATSSQWGGMAYLPTLPGARGPMTRSQVVLGHDWSPPGSVQRSQTVAHELGHNFARQHAPCGSPAGPDPHYPVPGGGIGEWVTWTTAFETGFNPTGVVLPATTGDLMGYCPDRYIGAYTYLGILQFRALQAAALLAPRERVAVLAVRGWADAAGARVTHAEFTEGEPIAEPAASPVELVVLDANGAELARARALLGAVGDAVDGQPFTAHLVLDAAARGRATTLLVRALGVERRVPVPRALP